MQALFELCLTPLYLKHQVVLNRDWLHHIESLQQTHGVPMELPQTSTLDEEDDPPSNYLMHNFHSSQSRGGHL